MDVTRTTTSTNGGYSNYAKNAGVEKCNSAKVICYFENNSQGAKIINFADDFLGFNEADASANKFLKETRCIGSPIKDSTSSSATPWCAAYVEYVIENFGGYENIASWYKNMPDENKWYCPYLLNEAQNASAIVNSDSAVGGDLVIFDHQRDGVVDHVGIFLYKDDDGTIYTIEGNSHDQVEVKSYPSNTSEKLYFLKMTD